MSTAGLPATATITTAPPVQAGRIARLRRLHALVRQHALAGGLPYWRQAAEMAYLKVTRDIGVNYYQMARMWRREMPWSEKVGHLGTAAYIRALAVANPPEYRKLSQHKLAEKALLTLLAVPTPRFLGFAHALGGRTATGAPLTTAADFARFIDSIDADRLCFKLMEGHSGSGFVAAQIVRASSGPVLLPIGSGDAMSPEDFHARHIATAKAGRLIEAFLDQHADMAWFNETSVNTLRILVYAPKGQPARIVGAYVRIGRQGSIVDNHGAGGLLAGIDPASGIVGTAFDARHETVRQHPDTGRTIEGRTIPYWREAVALTEHTLDAYPQMRFAGFDIAVTPSGPVVIEINNFPGTDGVACTNLQMAPVLRD